MDKQEEGWAAVRANIEERLETTTNENHRQALSGIIENTTSGRSDDTADEQNQNGNGTRKGLPKGRILSQVEKQETLWMWPGHLTSGITICYGLPGCGKSLFSSHYIAGLTQGWPNPDGTLREKGKAVTVAFEDSLESTTFERFDNAGANMDYISDITWVKKIDPYGGTLEKPFSLVSDQDELFYELTAMHASIAVLDPLSMLFDGISNYNNQKIGSCLWNLKVRAEREGVTILLIGHPNKNGTTLAGGAQLERIARIIFHFSEDTSRKNVCVMKNTKNNLTFLQPPMAFSTLGGKLEWIHGESPSDEAKHTAQRIGDFRQAMQERIDSNPDTLFGSRDFADLPNFNDNTARSKLKDMLAAGVVLNPEYGKYQSILCAKMVQQVQQVQQIAKEEESDGQHRLDNHGVASADRSSPDLPTDTADPLDAQQHVDPNEETQRLDETEMLANLVNTKTAPQPVDKLETTVL
jgi:hypothetical protein